MQHNFARWLVLTSAPIDLAAEFFSGTVKIEKAEMITV
jgi:hypothetical protein